MNYSELVRIAQTPGPMQGLAQQALMEEFQTDDRVDKVRGRNTQFDPQRYLRAYYDELGNHVPAVPEGDLSPEDWRQSKALRDVGSDLDRIYDRPWYEDAWNTAKGIGSYLTTPEGVNSALTTARDTFAPLYSQLDSEHWARDNLDQYLSMRDYDPLSATMYLPNVALGALGMIPGVSGLMGGGRKLGKGAQMLLEGAF